MHTNYRRKNRHRCYWYDNWPWVNHKVRWKYDLVSFTGYGVTRSFGLRVFPAPMKRVRAHARKMIRLERYDDILTRLPGDWTFDT